MFPARFTDGQLNLPESGNGIPDVLDEAAVQVDFFRKTQTPDGGVSGWVEQPRHPSHETPPDQDTRPFSTSLPERGASYAYAASAAYLARLIEPFDAPRAKEYVASAAKAYRWASDPAHSIRGVRFELPSTDGNDKHIKVQFDQPAELPGTQGSKTNPHFMLAAMQLYAATRDATYLKDWEEHQGVKEVLLRGQPDAVHPFAFVTPTLHPEWFGKEAADQLIAAARREADVLCEGQQKLAYRTLWYAPSHGYYPLMGWGNIHAGHAARYPIVCWRLTGEAKYRDAVLLALDWEFGCNEVGRSMVTGLGSTYPTCLQHITSERDEWLEPVPGIVPYVFTYGVAYPAWQTQFALLDPGHDSVKSFFKGQAVCLLPGEWGRAQVQSDLDRLPRTGDWPNAAVDRLRPAVEPRFPLMRRIYTHPTLAPPQNEFTVNETISPLAVACGAMLSEGWSPPPELKQRKPINKPDALPIYLQP
jgi:endoglucanase